MDIEKNQPVAGAKSVNPFLESKAACPMCNAAVVHRMIKTKLYSERSKDVDLRPTKLSWTDQELAKYHPRLYYMQHCQSCHFTAGHSVFAEPLRDCSMRFAKLRDTLLRLRTTDAKFNNVVALLSSDIDLKKLGLVQSLKLHLLAIFYLQLFTEFTQGDAMNLGRYCLRLAWLYRDIRELVEKVGQPPAKVTDLLASLKEDWPQVPDSEEAALKMAAAYFYTTLERSRAVKTGYDEVQLLLLIARIQMQLGNSKEARRFFSMGKEKARKFAAEAGKSGQRSAPGPEPSAEETARLRLEIIRLKNQIDEVETTFEDILDKQPAAP